MANSLHLHLILVHIPIVLYPLGVIILCLFYINAKQSFKTLGSSILIFATAIAISAYLAGEGAEELVEELPGILESAIERHSDAALISLWLSCITAALAALALFSKSWVKWTRPLFATLVLVSTISSLSFFWVGYQGGKIRHPEAYTSKGEGTLQQKSQDDDDD